MENKSNLDKQLKNKTLDAVQRMSGDINLLYKDYITDKPTNALSESIFTEYFLDFFKKFKNAEQEDLTPEEGIRLNKWIELAGGPYKEVSIVNNKGEEIYKVPAIYTSNTIESDNITEANTSLNAIGKTFTIKQETNPITAVPALHATLSGLPKFIQPIETEIGEIKRWEKIFKRYDKENNDDVIPNTDTMVTTEVKEKLGLTIRDDDDEDEPL